MNSKKMLVSFSFIFFYSCSYAESDLGFARLDDESYFLHSNSRPNNTLALVVAPDFKTSSLNYTSEIEIEGYMYINHPSSFTPESKNLYIASNPDPSAHHQVSLGRRIYNWSVADDLWKIGTWTPRFNWEPLYPEQVGNTGLFYTYDSANWHVLAFGSYVNVPERGVPLNSNLTSPSGDWVSPFSQVNLPALNNANIPIQYSLNYPPLSQLIFFPSAALQVKYGDKKGFWASAAYGFIPIHQATLLVEGVLPAQSLQLNVTIHPIILMQHLVTAETGVREDGWSFFASATREIPVVKDNFPATWIEQPIVPATLLSVGGAWEALKGITLSSSFLDVTQTLPTSNVPGNLSLNLPSRFPYAEAFQAKVDWKLNESWNYQALWIDDITNASQVYSFDVGYRPSVQSSWFMGVGTDIISSETNQGLIGQFDGDSRLRLRLNYAL